MSTTSVPTRTLRPFGWRDKIGYMFGDFGNDFTFMLQMMFFMVFYTDVMGINPAHVGLLFLVARIIDAFTDVGMGRLVDTLRPTAAGRFRPWILRGAIPVALAGSLMFQPWLADASYNARLAYMCITYLLWGSVFYTAINIPYGSMAAVVSDRPEHRSSLSVFRSMGAQLAFLIISAVLPNVVRVGNQVDPTRMSIASFGCAVAAVICYLICYFNVEERIQVAQKPKGEQASFGQMLATLGRNRPLIALIAAAIAFLIGSQIASGVTAYLWKDYFQDFGKMSLAQMVSILPVFVMSLVATKAAMKYGKKELIAAALMLAGAVSVGMWFMGITSPSVFIALFFVLSLGPSLYNVLVWAVITDVLDHQEVRTGNRDDGTIYALYSWSRKLGQAIAGWVVGAAIAGVGYDSAAAKAGIAQSQQAIDGIYLLFLLVPGLLYLLTAAIMMFAYPLGRRQVAENFNTLQARKAVQEPSGAQLADGRLTNSAS